jgi:uncharacterized protein YbjT (DUF2867 family)
MTQASGDVAAKHRRCSVVTAPVRALQQQEAGEMGDLTPCPTPALKAWGTAKEKSRIDRNTMILRKLSFVMRRPIFPSAGVHSRSTLRYSRPMSTFLVTGGTGRIGTAFVHEIAARGHSVRLGTRDAGSRGARLCAAFGPGRVDAVSLDVDDPASLDAGFAGVTGALLIAPLGEMQAWHEAMAGAARRAGVEHIVKVSVTGARAADSDPPPGRIPSLHFAGEQALRASGVPSTMIRPTIFAQHFLGLSAPLFRRGDASFHLPTGDARIAFLDCRDIAICAAHILIDEKKRAAWAGAAFELTGPTAVRAHDIEEILSFAGERPIKHVDGLAAFSQHAADIGVPDGIKGVYQEAAGGWFGAVHDQEFQQITGRHTTSFAKFVSDNAAFYT